jgi:hypothetical protein
MLSTHINHNSDYGDSGITVTVHSICSTQLPECLWQHCTPVIEVNLKLWLRSSKNPDFRHINLSHLRAESGYKPPTVGD